MRDSPAQQRRPVLFGVIGRLDPNGTRPSVPTAFQLNAQIITVFRLFAAVVKEQGAFTLEDEIIAAILDDGDFLDGSIGRDIEPNGTIGIERGRKNFAHPMAVDAEIDRDPSAHESVAASCL